MSEVEPKRSEEDQAFMDYVYAIRRRDFEAADKLIPKMKFPACHLMAGKKLFGAEFIRKYGYNTEEADKKYGPDWLDRDDGPPALPSFRASGRLSRMTAASDVLRAVYSLASIETRSVLKPGNQTEAIDRDETRQEIKDLLLHSSQQQDIDTILELERILLSTERECLGEAADKEASLDNALEELDATLTALAGIRDQDS